MKYTLVVRETEEPCLLRSSEGDAHAYLFSLYSDAEQFAAHLSHAEDVAPYPVNENQLYHWAIDLKENHDATEIVEYHPVHPVHLSIAMFLIRCSQQ